MILLALASTVSLPVLLVIAVAVNIDRAYCYRVADAIGALAATYQPGGFGDRFWRGWAVYFRWLGRALGT